MNTTPAEPNAARSSSLLSNFRRYRIGPRDVLHFVYLVVAFILVILVGLYAFALVFNEVTLYGWLFVGGLFLFRHGFIQYRNRLAVSGTATAKASSAAIGLSELSGLGYAENPGKAPVTRTECLFWALEVQQWQTQGRRRGWVTQVQRSFGVETLQLEDDSGRILVWTRGAELIQAKEVWKSKDGDPPETALRLVTAAGLKWPAPSSRHPMRITEQRIPAGGPLYVMGTLAERRQIPGEPKSLMPGFVSRWANGSPRMDGRSFLAALRFASHSGRRWLARELQAYVPRWSPPNVDLHQVLVWKGTDRRPFIISGLLERKAMRALSRRAWAYILGGGALMAGTIYVAVAKLTDVMR